MKNSILLLSAIAVLGTTSCKKDKWPHCIKANGKITEETRILSDFDEVSFDLSGNLYIKQVADISSPEIRVVTSENIMDRVETEVKGDRLTIGDDKCIRKLKDFDAYLLVKDIEEVNLNGSGKIIGQNVFIIDNMEMNINGSGDIDFDVEATKVSIGINGSGNVNTDGSTTDLDISINGSGDIRAFELESKEAYIDINGSGNCEVNVSDYLDVNISGSGDVIYEGTPKVKITNSGSGNVRSR